MPAQQKAYIAGIGMVTPLGFNTDMTAAAVKAGISSYQVSRFYNNQEQPITMSCVPDNVFATMDIDIDEGGRYNAQYDHIIKMAILALREATSNQSIEKSVPMVLALPEEAEHYIPPKLLISNLLKQKDLPLSADSIRFLSTGRAAGIQGLELALHYLYHEGANHVLLGGSDSYWSAGRIYKLDETERLLATNRMDGFVASEGAGFLLLTKNSEQAVSHNGYIVGLSQPGNSQEPGHYYSDQPYRGDGLDQAFKQALSGYKGNGIHTIYASMNGENYWAKEYGVATMRNKKHFHENVKIEHPADCLGDLGGAFGSVLLGLAAKDLLNQSGSVVHLVYSSSDSGWRSAVRMEKSRITTSA